MKYYKKDMCHIDSELSKNKITIYYHWS